MRGGEKIEFFKKTFLVDDRVGCSQSHAVSTVIEDFKPSNDFGFTIGS